jgi:hypothetical protein
MWVSFKFSPVSFKFSPLNFLIAALTGDGSIEQHTVTDCDVRHALANCFDNTCALMPEQKKASQFKES